MPELYCYDVLGLDHCECGKRNSWETQFYCDKVKLLYTPRPPENPRDAYWRERVQMLDWRIRHYTENAMGLQEDLIEMLYRTMYG